jgi:hypothetical protein
VLAPLALLLVWAAACQAKFMMTPLDPRKPNDPNYFTCGNHDPKAPASMPIAKYTDCAGNTLQVNCIQDTYFLGTIKRVDGTTYDFSKCVFTGALNKAIFLLDDKGNFKKIVWFNVENTDDLTFAQLCNGSNVVDTMDPKAFADAEAKIRKAIKDRGLDANIYTTSFSPGDQLIQRFELGVFQSDLSLTPSQADAAYAVNTGTSILALDPVMLTPQEKPQQQERITPEPGSWALALAAGIVLGLAWLRRRLPGSPALRRWAAAACLAVAGLVAPARAASVNISFASGPPSPGVLAISTLTPSTGLDFSGGTMNVHISNTADGVSLVPQTINAMCAVFQGLSLSDMPVGAGVGFQMVFGDFADGNNADLELFHVAHSTRVKIVQDKNGVKTELERVVAEIDPADVASVQVDWVTSPGILDRIQIEIKAKNGRKVNTIVKSGLTHDPTKKTAYRIHGLDITTDPTVSVGELDLKDTHLIVPEPSSLVLVGSAVLIAGLVRRRATGRG